MKTCYYAYQGDKVSYVKILPSVCFSLLLSVIFDVLIVLDLFSYI